VVVSYDVVSLYRHRFEPASLEPKRRIWEVLCRDFFSRWIDRDSTVLDLGCGYGEFINHIEARHKFAVDLNPDAPSFLDPGVAFIKADASRVDQLADASVDIIFTSNFLEHLPDKTTLRAVLAEMKRLLRPGGRVLMMGPNIRLVGGAYWDFWDHHLPLTEHSLTEGLSLEGFEMERVIARFLPYTTRSALPQRPWLVALYLRVPLAWRLLGKQFFIVARKPR
jgi:SAM-dependent methyltransferase